MKLSSAQTQRTQTQFEAQPIPESHPSIPKLHQLFGDHTFFLGDEGLCVVEPTDADAEGDVTGKVIKLANWKDESQTSLTPCEPEETDRVVVLALKDGAS